MPSRSPAQHRLMEAAAHDPKFAKKAGVPRKVAEKFVSADEKEERREGKRELERGEKPHGYGR